MRVLILILFGQYEKMCGMKIQVQSLLDAHNVYHWVIYMQVLVLRLAAATIITVNVRNYLYESIHSI